MVQSLSLPFLILCQSAVSILRIEHVLILLKDIVAIFVFPEEGLPFLSLDGVVWECPWGASISLAFHFNFLGTIHYTASIADGTAANVLKIDHATLRRHEVHLVFVQ